MINSNVKIHILLHILNTFMIRTRHILLKFQRLLFSEVPLNDIWKWVRNLILSSHNPTNEACSANLDLVNGLEVDFLKTFVYEGPNIKLQVHPHAFHDHATWDPRMQGKSVDVIFTIRIELSAIKDKPASFSIGIGKSNFKVKSLLVRINRNLSLISCLLSHSSHPCGNGYSNKERGEVVLSPAVLAISTSSTSKSYKSPFSISRWCVIFWSQSFFLVRRFFLCLRLR